MAGFGNLIKALQLFTLERPQWTVEEAAIALEVSNSSAYRYFATLNEAGLIVSTASGSYTLGPAIIQLDRQIRLTDPLLESAVPVMTELVKFATDRTTILLSRVFKDNVICLHQILNQGGVEPRVWHERGAPRPLFRGATARVILANFPPRQLRRIYDAHAEEIAALGLGQDLESFRKGLKEIRKNGYAVTEGEIDSEHVAVAAPIFDDNKRILGSLSYILDREDADDLIIARLIPLIQGGAREIETAMGLMQNHPGHQARKA